MKLYLAPINAFTNYIYRHLILKEGVDFVFSELIRIDRLDKEIRNDKLKVYKNDLSKTIFQIGVSSTKEIDTAIQILPKTKEININMGCPQSSMRNVCGALLKNEALMDTLSKHLRIECNKRNIIPSVKIRLGLSEKDIRLKNYLDIFEKNKIKKVYIHARPLRYPYARPAMYEPIFQIKKNYSFKITINGDIDNYFISKHITDKFNCDLMIGRTALSNPFIFKQIKNKQNPIDSPYNPIKKDPEIIIIDDKFYLSEKKQKFIEKYISFAKKEHLRKELIEINLKTLTKGISDSKSIIKNYLDKLA